MIPQHRNNGTLPIGVHLASWDMVAARFGRANAKRRKLLEGLESMCRHLKDAGATKVWLDGSFVTKKPVPGDYDLAYPMLEVDATKLSASIVSCDKEGMKSEFKGEAWADCWPQGFPGMTTMNLFQTILETGKPKGIVELDLGTLP